MAVRPQVVVYVKPTHDASQRLVAMLERIRSELDFDLEKVEAASDRDFRQKFGKKAPVLSINGERVAKSAFSEDELRERLKVAGGGSVTPEPVVVEALEALVSTTPRVPAAVMAAILAVAVLGFGYFVREGIANAALGRGRLAQQLLQVETRDDGPPRFTLESLDGEHISSDERFRDRVVFINFWATWCPPCVEEMPSMLRLQAKMSDDPRFEMLAISADEEWAPVRKFFEDKPPFRVLLDREGKLAKTYGTTKFPETYVIVDGRLAGYIVGPRDWDTWYAEAYLRSVLEHGAAL